MAVGESPAVARHRLRHALRQARDDKGLTQRQVAEALEWSMAKVNRIEAGEVTISTTDLRALLRLLDVTDPERVAALLDEARDSRRRGWWDQPTFRDHLTPAIIQSLQFEVEAGEIRSFQPTYLPGLLQTPEYAAAIVDLWSDELPESDQTVRVEVRARRREQLFSLPDPPRYLVTLDESVLLREVGGPATASAQLYDLLAQVRANRVDLRVLPFAQATAFDLGGFVIYTNDDEDVALYRESFLADEIVYSSDTIRRHRHIFEQIWDRSLGPDATARRLEAQAAVFRSAADRHQPDG